MLFNDGKIITLNDDLTFRFQNPSPTGDETNYDKTGTFTVVNENDETFDVIFNFINQKENGVYKSYKNKLDVSMKIFKNENKVQLLKWRLNEQDVNSDEGSFYNFSSI